MLNEPGALLDDERRPARRDYDPTDAQIDETDNANTYYEDEQFFALRELINDVMEVSAIDFPDPDHPMVTRDDMVVMNPDSILRVIFRGELTIDSEIAYDHLDNVLASQYLLPMFRTEDGETAIYIVDGRSKPLTGGNWLSLILFVLTVLSLLYVGALMGLAELAESQPFLARRLSNNILPELWRGAPYAISIVLILGAHELGHYFASRYHRVAASLPYFIPFPFGLFGTFGAAIRLREPMRNRKMLHDIGAAGPLAGMAFAVPILFIGLATSNVGPISVNGLTEGNSILYALAKFITFGEFLPDGRMDVYVNQLAWAGWTGLFVTGLNLIPLGQLDGGHVMYSLIGYTARRLYYPAILLMGGLVLLTNSALVILLIMLVVLGRVHATPLDDITPLNPARKLVAIFTLLIFVLVFVPVPISQTGPGITNLEPGQSAGLMIAALWTLRRR